MTAQIQPTRMEVSDRFPMLGFTIRTDEPNVDAEVVLSTDIGLFQAQHRASRTAANFYSSREDGRLSLPRGEGVFIVPPEVLARFIGSDKLYFGLATGRSGNGGGLYVDALPREGSPYVSLRGFTGRTLRRSPGSPRRVGAPVFEWAGDAARPGSERSNGSAARPVGNGPTNGVRTGANGGAHPGGNGGAGAAPVPYNDGFGPLPEMPAREAAYRPDRSAGSRFGLQMSDSLTAERALQWLREVIEKTVAAVGEDVSPPKVYRLGDSSGTFRTVWINVFRVTSLLSPSHAFLAALPELADRTGVTLSIGPALDTPLFGGGVGVVFEPGGQVALFGTGEISVDFDGLSEFVSSLKVALQAKMKLGYNRGGIAAFANLGKVASAAAGEEIVVGAEVWLDAQGNGIGGAVSIGVGFALQFAAEEAPILVPRPAGDERQRAQQLGGQFAPRIERALDLGLDPRQVRPLLEVLEAEASPQPMTRLGRAQSDDQASEVRLPPPPPVRARAMDGGAAAAIAIGSFLLETIRDSQGDVTWDLQQLRGWKHPNDQTPPALGSVQKGPTIHLNDWPTAGGLVDEISAWFKIDWQYNGRSVGNVLIINDGVNDAVGWGLHVAARINFDDRLKPPNDCVAVRIIFEYRFSRSIGSDVIAHREVTLYGDGTWEAKGSWVQASALGMVARSAEPAYAS